MKFHHDTPNSKGTRGQKPFMYIDKSHNSVKNYQNLPINNPKRDIVVTNAYAKFECNPLINTEVIERKRSADGRVYGLRTDGQCDGQTETRSANVKT